MAFNLSVTAQELNSAIDKAKAAAPQSTTYNKTEIDALLAKKPGEITTGKQYTIDGKTVTAGTGAEAFNNLTNNKASGEYSHAEGTATTALGASSHAEGASTKASGSQSHAEGAATTASEPQSHAEGMITTASAAQSHAEGQGTTASGPQSHAEGSGTRASGNSSHAEGAGTTAFGANSHAEGMSTKANDAQSHAEGTGTNASSLNQHVQGRYNVVDPNNRFAFIIGNGAADNARHNAFAIDWNGLIYVNGAATGVDVSALAPQSTTYTKNEVDTALSGKANTSDLGAAAAKGFDSTPTAGHTDYAVSSDGVHKALAAKLNTADVDDALSSTSTNPVQNRVVQAPIARLVDAGAKNLFDLDNSTFTSSPVSATTATKNADGSVLVSAIGSGVRVARFTVNLQSGVAYRLSGCPSGGGGDTYSLDVRDLTNNQIPNSFDTGSGSELFTVPTSGAYYLGVRFANGYTTPSEGITIYPMLCKEEDYKISAEFVPYAPSNRELYEMILALQNAQNGG